MSAQGRTSPLRSARGPTVSPALRRSSLTMLIPRRFAAASSPRTGTRPQALCSRDHPGRGARLRRRSGGLSPNKSDSRETGGSNPAPSTSESISHQLIGLAGPHFLAPTHSHSRPCGGRAAACRDNRICDINLQTIICATRDRKNGPRRWNAVAIVPNFIKATAQ